jgi:hypothetical protein
MQLREYQFSCKLPQSQSARRGVCTFKLKFQTSQSPVRPTLHGISSTRCIRAEYGLANKLSGILRIIHTRVVLSVSTAQSYYSKVTFMPATNAKIKPGPGGAGNVTIRFSGFLLRPVYYWHLGELKATGLIQKRHILDHMLISLRTTGTHATQGISERGTRQLFRPAPTSPQKRTTFVSRCS